MWFTEMFYGIVFPGEELRKTSTVKRTTSQDSYKKCKRMKSVLRNINSHLLQLLLVCGVTCYGLWRSDDYMLFGCWKLYEAVCSHPWSQVQYRDGITPRHPSPSLLSSLYSWNTSRRCSTMQAHALHPIPYTVQKARDRSLRTSHMFASYKNTQSPVSVRTNVPGLSMKLL